MNVNRLHIIYVFVFLCINLLWACSDEHVITQPEQESALPLSINVVKSPTYFGNNIYPSFQYMVPFLPVSRDTLDFLNNIFELMLKSIPDKARRIVIRMEAGEFNEASEIIYVPEDKEDSICLRPQIKWKYDRLLANKQSRNITLNWLVNCGDKNIPIQYTYSLRSINELPFGIVTEHNDTLFLPELFCGYINEEHSLLDEMQKELIRQGMIDDFEGYLSGNDNELYNEIWSVTFLMQQRNLRYSNSAVIPGTDGSSFQRVRMLEEVYESGLANCLDGVCFFASFYLRLGLDVALVFTPGHCFLRVEKNESGDYWYIETTMLGMIDLNYYDDDEKIIESLGLFEKALRTGDRNYREALNGLQAGDPDYKIVNVNKIRKYIPILFY